ncbi:MAG: MFS transporter [Syntrophobacterales bacterium]|jgi:FSR family fosmidomycin resistance protein-like MFS transporter|nr:MFS transporter [Syntrophobacterales bacterium]
MKKFNLKALLLLSLGHMVVDIYQGALPALLPFLKEKLSLTYTMAGVVLVMSNFASSILQPLFGYYSDKKEKAVLLPVGLLFAGMSFALLSLADIYVLVLVLTALSGLGIAAYHPEGYKTAHFFTGERSATGMSIFSVGGNLGLSLGPVCVVYIIQYLGLPYLPVIVLPALLMTLVILIARKTVAIPAMEHADRQTAAAAAPKGAMLSLITVIGIVVARTWTQMGLVSYIPFYYINYLKGEPVFAGKLVFTFLVCGALGTLIGSPIADRIGLRTFLRLTMFLGTIVLPLMFVPFINQSWLLFVVLGVEGALIVSTFSVTVVIGQKLLPHRLGVASGLLVGFAIGAGGVGVTLLGVIADTMGVPLALEAIMLLPLIGFILSLILRFKG